MAPEPKKRRPVGERKSESKREDGGRKDLLLNNSGRLNNNNIQYLVLRRGYSAEWKSLLLDIHALDRYQSAREQVTVLQN